MTDQQLKTGENLQNDEQKYRLSPKGCVVLAGALVVACVGLGIFLSIPKPPDTFLIGANNRSPDIIYVQGIGGEQIIHVDQDGNGTTDLYQLACNGSAITTTFTIPAVTQTGPITNGQTTEVTVGSDGMLPDFALQAPYTHEVNPDRPIEDQTEEIYGILDNVRVTKIEMSEVCGWRRRWAAFLTGSTAVIQPVKDRILTPTPVPTFQTMDDILATPTPTGGSWPDKPIDGKNGRKRQIPKHIRQPKTLISKVSDFYRRVVPAF